MREEGFLFGYSVNMRLFIVFSLLIAQTELRRNSFRGTHWWILAVDYDKPESNLETNEITPAGKNVLQNQINPRMLSLTRKQQKLLERNPGAIGSVSRGARLAIRECQYQFRSRRWNCPVKESELSGSIFGEILNIGCRETAFIYAITAAAVAHSTAWDCSRGRIQTCTCDYRQDKPAGKDWSWGGCSDNVKFGYRFSKKFIDSIERGEDLRYMVNRQNNEAGRRHVLKETTQQCKCHGMSGSCAMKTCWMRLPEFRTVGSKLKERFDGASKVYAGNGWASTDNRVSSRSLPSTKRSRSTDFNTNRMLTSNKVLSRDKKSGRRRKKNKSKTKFNFIPVDANHKNPTRKDMVYFEDSPNFCLADNATHISEGTQGRYCNATSLGIDGCDLMCCDRGYHTEKYIARERCSCTFKWCCEVICKVCTEERTRYVCK